MTGWESRVIYRSLVLVAAVVGVCLLVSAASLGGNAHARSGSPCEAGQLVVTLNGRASCRSPVAVFGRPRRGDIRLAVLRSALFDSSSPFGRFGAAGKQARARFLRALPKVLALIDARTKKPG